MSATDENEKRTRGARVNLLCTAMSKRTRCPVSRCSTSSKPSDRGLTLVATSATAVAAAAAAEVSWDDDTSRYLEAIGGVAVRSCGHFY